MESKAFPEVMNVEEAMEYLRLSRPAMYKALKRNEVPHVRIGRRILISKAALERLFIKDAAQQAQGCQA